MLCAVLCKAVGHLHLLTESCFDGRCLVCLRNDELDEVRIRGKRSLRNGDVVEVLAALDAHELERAAAQVDHHAVFHRLVADEAEVSLVLGGEQVDLGVDGTFDDRNCRCRVSAVAQDRSGKDVDALAADVASALEMRVQDVDRLAHALSCELPILNIGGQACHDLVIQDAFDVFACYGTLAVPVIPDLEHHRRIELEPRSITPYKAIERSISLKIHRPSS